MENGASTGERHRWRFFRAAGFDQVRLETADDLRRLRELDRKLWTVLSCPTRGLELDSRTLELLDTDADGYVRVSEVLAAVEWACHMLKDPGKLFDGGDLPLDAINDAHAEGAAVLAAARRALEYLGKPEATSIGVSDFADPTKLFAADHFNGDGVVPPDLARDEDLRRAIVEILMTVGGAADRSGEQGVTTEHVETFFNDIARYLEWHDRAENDSSILPLGPGTAAAADAIETVREKVDDYFARCRLAAFDPRAEEALNPAEAVYAGIAERALGAEDEAIAALPLTTVAAGKPLPLGDGINPAWAERIRVFGERVVAPLLDERDVLTAEDWRTLTTRFAAYRQWLAERPDTGVAALEIERLRELHNSSVRERLLDLIQQDLEADTSAVTILAAERLARYQRDLVRLLRNFVTMSDFYLGRDKAIFQAGTLYIDHRSCDLVMRVADMARHEAIAPLSGCYLVYCNCTRVDAEPITIVAAVTGGDVDELMVPGRNGIFYDRQGREWNATVIKVVEQPVSIRQAFWSPYRRVARLIEDQIRKFAADRDRRVEDVAGERVARVTDGVTAAPAADASTGGQEPRQSFDIAKFAGIFAALGLAAGAIGVAFGTIVSELRELAWWQFPLVIAGVLLVISGPSMLLAWLTLRRRNLGPLLDANGWAVNTRARINVRFGESMTAVAALPPGASRTTTDPFADPRRGWKVVVIVVLLVVALVALWRGGLLTFSVSDSDSPPPAEQLETEQP